MPERFTRLQYHRRVKRGVLAAAIVLSACGPAAQNPGSPQSVETRRPNGKNQQPAFPEQTRAPLRRSNVAFDVVTVARGLQNPWGLAFLPDGRMLVTEKPGRLRIVSPDGTLSPPVDGLPPVAYRGQGGLLDVAVDPAFAANALVYWTYAEPRDGDVNNTAAARGRLNASIAPPRLDDVQVIFHQRPSLASAQHFGGRLVFAPDGKLFVTLGERSILEGRVQARRLDGLLGKIVRINPDGTIPEDNPFVNRAGARPEIWSIGHRNIQGAAINPATGELWAVEHGTRGGDEINIVRKGKDYGWPSIAYGIEYYGGPISGGITAQQGLEQPRYYWDPIIGPSGMMFYTGDLFPEWRGTLFIGGLASMHIAHLTIDGDNIVGEERLLTDLKPQPERIRDVRQGPEGAVYVLTDSNPGRLLKLVPKR